LGGQLGNVSNLLKILGMQEQTYIAVAALVNSDQTLDKAARSVILDVCRNPTATSNCLPASEPKFLSTKDVAERLRVDLKTVYRWRISGVLPSYKWRGYRRYRVEDVEKLERQFVEEPIDANAQEQ